MKTTDKAKRYNLNDHFEDVYLRSKTLRRYIDKTDTNIMRSTETAKVINYATERQMSVYGKMFQWNAFDREDIRSIVSIFACCFTGLEVQDKPKRDYYYLMMNFIDQRMEFFVGCMLRKFQYNDVVCYNVLNGETAEHGFYDEQFRDDPMDFVANKEKVAEYVSGPFAEPEISYVEKAEKAEDELETLKIQHCDAVQGNEPKKRINSLARNIRRLTGTAQSYNQKANQKRKEEQKLNIELKKKFTEDPHKHAEQLSYYATYKGVPYDVRRVAKRICKKYGIDYVSYVGKNRTQSDESCFNMR